MAKYRCYLKRKTEKARAISATFKGPIMWVPKADTTWSGPVEPGTDTMGTIMIPGWLVSRHRDELKHFEEA